jgi:hypothetical protein
VRDEDSFRHKYVPETEHDRRTEYESTSLDGQGRRSARCAFGRERLAWRGEVDRRGF